MRALVAVLVLSAVACDSEAELCEDSADCAGGGTCGPSGRCLDPSDGSPPDSRIRLAPTRDLDLLFLIDDTTRLESQADLTAEVPRLLTALTTGQLPGSETTFEPFESIHLGVITSDMGSGPEGECDSLFGKDGVLQTQGNTANPSCLATYPSWLSFASADGAPTTLAEDAVCLLSALGYQGCGFEQPLEALLKALTPSTTPITFSEDTVGHGDGQNAGFLRPDSLLAILALSDEDDCSASDLGLFDAEDPRFDPNLNLRCLLHPEAVHPTSRYVDGLLALRPERPDRLFYGLIAGVPTDLVPSEAEPLAPQLTEALADPRMVPRPSELDATQLEPSCGSGPGEGRFHPPTRLVAVAAGLATTSARVWVDSGCQESLEAPIDRILRRMAELR